MELKHTKGPWKIYQTEEVETGLDIVIESDLWTMGWLYSKNKDSEANARLISCAPEMLEILIRDVKLVKENFGMRWRLLIDEILETKETSTITSTIKKGAKEIKAKIIIIEKATGMPIEEVLK